MTKLCECHNEPMYWHKNEKRTSGGQYRCAVKARAISRRRYMEDVDKHRQRVRTYRQNHKDEITERAKEKKWIHNLKTNYGITEAQWITMLVLQDSQCAICQKDFPNRRAIHVDHDHATGKVRKLLCRSCNIGMHYFDNPVLRDKMLEYAEAYETA